MNAHILSATPLFRGVKDRETRSVLKCLSTEEKSFQEDAYIYRAGDITDWLGVMVGDSVNIIKDDVWRDRKIIENIGQGQVFVETYVCLKGEALMVDVQASKPVRVLFMDVNRILATYPSTCNFHTRLVRNLMYVPARKNLMLTRRMDVITPKSLRERILVYLSQEAAKQDSRKVTVPFSR